MELYEPNLDYVLGDDATVAVVVVLLQDHVSGNEDVAKAGLNAIALLALSDDNNKLLGAAGACDGNQLLLLHISTVIASALFYCFWVGV